MIRCTLINPRGREENWFKDVPRLQFVGRKWRTVSSKVQARWKRCKATRRATLEEVPSVVCRTDGIWRWEGWETASGTIRRLHGEERPTARVTGVDAGCWEERPTMMHDRPRSNWYGCEGAGEVPPRWWIVYRSTSLRRSNYTRTVCRRLTSTGKKATEEPSGRATTTPSLNRISDGRIACIRSDMFQCPSLIERCACCTDIRCSKDPCRLAPRLRRRPESWHGRNLSTGSHRSV